MVTRAPLPQTITLLSPIGTRIRMTRRIRLLQKHGYGRAHQRFQNRVDRCSRSARQECSCSSYLYFLDVSVQGLQYMPGLLFCRYMSHICMKAISDYDRQEYGFIHCNSGCTWRATLPLCGLPACCFFFTQRFNRQEHSAPMPRRYADYKIITLKTRLHILSSRLNVQPDIRVIKFQRNGLRLPE